MSILQDLAGQADTYRQQYQSGQISPSDYKELIGDLNIAQSIQGESLELQEDIAYYNILMTALQIAEAIE